MAETLLADAREIRRSTARLLRRRDAEPVSQFCAREVQIPDGTQVRPFSADLAPYMVEPMNLLPSRLYEAVIFAGPARSGKSVALIDCAWAYAVACAPGDTLLLQMTRLAARDHSKKRVDKMIRNSPALAAELSPRAHDDNTHDKVFRNGMTLTLGWPTAAQLASRSFRYVLITDLDKMDEDVDGEGDVFGLASTRTLTFRSAGMSIAEAAPGTRVLDRKWRAPKDAPHMMAPARGIAALYNSGDRRRWYWHCRHCRTWHRPEWPDCITWDDEITDPDLAAETVRYVCPNCGVLEEPSIQISHNRGGVWCPEGMEISADGELLGEPRRTRRASFAMEGPAAAYRRPQALVAEYLRALRDFELTNSEGSLQKFYNTTIGRPYIGRHAHEARLSEDLLERVEQLGYRVVPQGVRFLTAAVDVQKNRFVVQVHGWGVDLEQWVVDRFTVFQSSRRDRDGKRLPIEPAVYLEDWKLLVEQVIARSYELDDGSGRRMGIKVSACDSGGVAGVTDKAYEFWRWLRRQGLTDRFILVKGERRQSAQRVKLSYPDSDRKDRKAKARGEIPVYLLNTTDLKDTTDAELGRTEPGPKFVHLPDWLDQAFFDELTAEERGPKGWERQAGRANEAFDLFVYARAGVIAVKAERIRWEEPPAWAREWDRNSLVVAGNDSAAAGSTAPRRRRGRRVRSRGVT